MRINTSQSDLLKKKFSEMENKSDFLNILNSAKKIIYGANFQPFSIQQLNYYINKNSKKYFSFSIPKKNGDLRIINSPEKGLKEFQKAIALILQANYVAHPNAMGFVNGKSILNNATVHIGKNYVYNIDLKDFFSSIDQPRVWGRLLTKPFNLNSTLQRSSIASMIATLTCHTLEVERLSEGVWVKVDKKVLPQGAPSSPIITNIICERLDRRLTGVAKRFGLVYTRYADDITFSSMHNTHVLLNGKVETIFEAGGLFYEEIARIINEQNFFINENKTRLQKRGYRQQVTGLNVNEKVNVHRKYTKQIRQWIYYWERYGYQKANTYFSESYLKNKKDKLGYNPSLHNVLEGKLLYYKMIKSETDNTYLKLKSRFDTISKEIDPIEMILKIWERDGISMAMSEFYKNVDNGKR